MKSKDLQESDWQDFNESFDYVKDFYQVLLPNGEIVSKCWPNAGNMHETSGPTRRQWTPSDGVQVRIDQANTLNPKSEIYRSMPRVLVLDQGPIGSSVAHSTAYAATYAYMKGMLAEEFSDPRAEIISKPTYTYARVSRNYSEKERQRKRLELLQRKRSQCK